MRPKNFIDISGLRFGRWTVLYYESNGKWACRCDCGEIRSVSKSNLKSGKTKSCGCMANELSMIRQTKHGMHGSREYSSWLNMKSRCRSKIKAVKKVYYDRGISVCDEWLDFSKFIEDMGLMPGDGYSIDRIDNNLGYFKENCRWATSEQQSENRRCTKRLIVDGCEMTIKDIAKKYGISKGTIHGRIILGWCDEDVAKTPILDSGCYKDGRKSKKIRK